MKVIGVLVTALLVVLFIKPSISVQIDNFPSKNIPPIVSPTSGVEIEEKEPVEALETQDDFDTLVETTERQMEHNGNINGPNIVNHNHDLIEFGDANETSGIAIELDLPMGVHNFHEQFYGYRGFVTHESERVNSRLLSVKHLIRFAVTVILFVVYSMSKKRGFS